MAAYGSVDSHRSMVFDERRNRAYGAAIAAAVTPESVVLDLGCGLGIHGLMAARAGAGKVYMVEPEPIIELTRRVVAANGFDNVELLRGTAESVDLPEQVDLIVSVFTGNFLVTEDLLPSLFVARDRFLRSGGKLLPGRARMIAAPVTCAEYYNTVVSRWAAPAQAASMTADGFDYSAVHEFAANATYYDSSAQFGAQFLAQPGTLQELDFYSAAAAVVDHQVGFTADSDGLCHGWLGWFDMELGEQWLSTSPQAPALHWSQMYMPLPEPVQVRSGDDMVLAVQRPVQGDWTWRSTFASGEFRGSTFLQEPVDLGLLKRLGEHSQARRGVTGEVALLVLQMMDGEHTNEAIAAQLLARWPQTFNATSALQEVQAVVRRYS